MRWIYSLILVLIGIIVLIVSSLFGDGKLGKGGGSNRSSRASKAARVPIELDDILSFIDTPDTWVSFGPFDAIRGGRHFVLWDNNDSHNRLIESNIDIGFDLLVLDQSAAATVLDIAYWKPKAILSCNINYPDTIIYKPSKRAVVVGSKYYDYWKRYEDPIVDVSFQVSNACESENESEGSFYAQQIAKSLKDIDMKELFQMDRVDSEGENNIKRQAYTLHTLNNSNNSTASNNTPNFSIIMTSPYYLKCVLFALNALQHAKRLNLRKIRILEICNHRYPYIGWCMHVLADTYRIQLDRYVYVHDLDVLREYQKEWAITERYSKHISFQTLDTKVRESVDFIVSMDALLELPASSQQRLVETYPECMNHGFIQGVSKRHPIKLIYKASQRSLSKWNGLVTYSW